MDEEELYASLGRNLSARRRELRKTQAEIAKAIGLSRASLANIERGKQKVLLNQVYRLANALELDDVRVLLPLGKISLKAAVPFDDSLVINEPEEGLTANQRRDVERLFSSVSGRRS